ncbi:MAG: ArsB/NhaD family transporter, partial [Bacteroidales bacterium]|nr:ArsB/NhaD family transporter [Bacteroidales bacterium]
MDLAAKIAEDPRYREACQSCINCGVCTAICPAAVYFPYDPRQIVNEVLEGNEEMGIGWSATFGAIAALLTGVIHLADIPAVWHIVWNATITFVATIIISLLLDEAGFFEWAALR